MANRVRCRFCSESVAKRPHESLDDAADRVIHAADCDGPPTRIGLSEERFVEEPEPPARPTFSDADRRR